MRGPSPNPDDPALSTCNECACRYNPYGHRRCPACDGYTTENPCSSVDCLGPECPEKSAADAAAAFREIGYENRPRGPADEP
jgi:hypothetical protein